MNKLISLVKPIFILICIFNSFLHSQDIDSTNSVFSDSSIYDSTNQIDNETLLKIGDISDGNKSVPVHLIPLKDENGYTIHSDDNYLLPFSTKYTCGDCHSYNIIGKGSHFAIDTIDSLNRIGEPFIYTNHKSLTLLPLSYKEWDGTFNPKNVGIDNFDFLKLFGSHYTGGNISENPDLEELNNYLRWQVSGKLEINCLVCHDQDPEFDQAEFAKHLSNENFRWATSAASSIANVKGKASKMPDNYDPYTTHTYVDVDLRTSPPPTINYNTQKFDEDNKVFFNIEKRIDNKRCLFCHSSSLNTENTFPTNHQTDVHISKGMLCVDCHKNDLSHDIISGRTNEYLDKSNDELFSFSCEGCHLKANGESVTGMYGAPKPLHEGIPQVHFDKLSCTVCHSSYQLSDEANLIKTSRAHKLGVPGPNKMPSTYPLIQSPIFVSGANGKIEPRNVVWPSYWGLFQKENIAPLDIKFVNDNITPHLGLDTTFNFGAWPQISDSLLSVILLKLNSENKDSTNIVFVSGGKFHRLDTDSSIVSVYYKNAEPYSWPIAHNVRPATQSLGINGCDDCHSLSSDFFHSKVNVISSIIDSDQEYFRMIDYQDYNSYYQGVFSFSFYFRPFLKLLLILSTIIISFVVLAYLFSGILSFTKYFSEDSETNIKSEN